MNEEKGLYPSCDEPTAENDYSFTWEELKRWDSRNGGIRRAKWHIVSALVDMIEEGESLEKISIKEISKAAGISRQTFYNHFLDKYDAINWLRARIDEYTVDRIGVNLTWEQATKNRLEIMKHAPKFFTEVFRTEEFYEYATNEAEIVHRYYEQNLRRLTGKELNETEQYLLKLYVEGSVRTTASWLKNDQGKSPSFIVGVLGQALPDFVKKAYFGFYNQ